MVDSRHVEERNLNFSEIAQALGENVKLQTASALAVEGDSLEMIKLIPNESVSLILTDPPYHSTKKDNITNDTAFKSDQEFLDWVGEYSKEWKRILRPNGSIFFFCSSTMSARLEVLLSAEFNILSHIVWTKPNMPGFEGWKQKMNKEALRQWYAHSERIIFVEPATEGNLKRSWFGNFLREKRKVSGLSGHQLTALTGAYGAVNHGGAVSNWETGRNIPSRDQYMKICDSLINTGKIDTMPPYENVIRPFDVNSEVEFTDVWNFFSVKPYKGKHPAEKPLDMLEHCILSCSYENDIVLDCFAGSGSTAIAALKTKRKTISIEIEPHWVNYISDKILSFVPDNEIIELDNNSKTRASKKEGKPKHKKSKAQKKPDEKNHQADLFALAL